tara:strand:- start:3111 stop:3302 length:192 start_codon:yes stop_codon:yes gene_type:complete
MDKYIYGLGNKVCSVMDTVGLNKFNDMIGCNPYDNYSIGLFTGLIIIFAFTGGGFFGFSSSED